MAEPTTTPAPSVGRAAFTFILIMVALDFLAFGIIVPVLPDLIRSFEGGDFARASAITGYFGFAWNAMQFIFSPLLGAWSDRFGRRPVILISCFGLSIDYVFMALALSLAVCRPDHLRHYRLQRGHRFRLHHRCHSAGRTAQKVRLDQRRLRPRLRHRSCRGRVSWQYQSSVSFLG